MQRGSVEVPEMRSRRFLIASLILIMGLTFVPQFTAYPSGFADNAVADAGCYCHDIAPNGDDGTITPSIEGIPEAYEAGATYLLNISMSGEHAYVDNPDNQGGFLLRASSGILEPVDNTTGRSYGADASEYSGTDLITHSEVGNDQRSWSVNWIAPDAAGENIEFTIWVNAVNGADGNSGDKYGGASVYIGAPTASPLVVLLTAVLLALTLVIGAAVFVTAQINPGTLSWSTIGPWLKGWMTTTDHKGIGTLYIVFGLTFFVVGGILALLFRIQLAVPENNFLTQQQYNQFFTLHGTTMIFLAAMPLIAGFANWIVPLQIGAQDLAFPRVNALSFWILPAAAILLFYGIFTGEAAEVGWTGYAPYSSTTMTLGTTMWVAGTILLGASSTLAGVNFLTTIFAMRAPGVSWMRIPLFTWSILIANFMLFISIPALGIGVIFLLLDRTVGTAFYDIAAGGDPLLWSHLFWYFGHPEVYVVILPAFGVISEVLSTSSHRPIFGYRSMVIAMAGIGVLGFIVWGHHMLTSGMAPWFRFVMMLTTMLVAVPTGVKIFNWMATMYGGNISFDSHMLWALGFLVTFTIGGISGMYFPSIPIDLHLHETYFVVAHFHYVLVGGTLFGMFSALYYWYPKMTGRMLSERWGKIHFIIAFTSYNMVFWPMHKLGLDGMLRRTHTYASTSGFADANMLITVSSFIFGLSTLILVGNMIISLRTGKVAGPNPWGGWSLEWTTDSPPPTPSFAEIPVQIDEEHEAKEGGGGTIGKIINRIWSPGSAEVSTTADEISIQSQEAT